MAHPHDPGGLLAPGSALLALGLLLHPGLVAQNGNGGTKPPKKPMVKAAGDAGAREAGAARKKLPKATSSLRIAVVNMDLATRAHPLFAAKFKEHAEWVRTQSAELTKLDKSIQTKRAQLKNTVQRDTPAASKLVLEIETLSYKLSCWTKQLRTQRIARNNRLLLELQTQVGEAIKELAPKRGIDLVLRLRAQHIKDPLGEQVHRAQSTDVLYAAATLDMTEDVIDFLKTKYRPK